MADSLEDLWYGKLHPQESFLRGNEAFHQQVKMVTAREETLLKTLNKEQQRAYMLVQSEADRLLDLSSLQAFRYGFRLGASLLYDSQVMKESPKQKQQN